MLLKSSLCNWSDAYIFYIVFKISTPSTDFITELNNMQADNAKDTDVLMSKYNLIKYGDIYLKTFGSLWQQYIDESALYKAGNIIDFRANNITIILLKFKKITG